MSRAKENENQRDSLYYLSCFLVSGYSPFGAMTGVFIKAVGLLGMLICYPLPTISRCLGIRKAFVEHPVEMPVLL